MSLTPEQRDTVRRLRREIADLNLQADEQWAKYIQTKDEDCYQAVLALESEAAMMSAVAYVPKKGERKVGRVRDLIAKLRGEERGEFYQYGPWTTPEGTEARIRSLEQVNAWREQYDLPPLDRLPAGIPGDSHECTLAKAFKMSIADMGGSPISVSVSGNSTIEVVWENEAGIRDYSMPRFDSWASKLISNFDDFAFLDLVEDLSTVLTHRWEKYYENYYIESESVSEPARAKARLSFLESDEFAEVMQELERRGTATVWETYAGGFDYCYVKLGPGEVRREYVGDTISLDEFREKLNEFIASVTADQA